MAMNRPPIISNVRLSIAPVPDALQGKRITLKKGSLGIKTRNGGKTDGSNSNGNRDDNN